MLKILTQPPHMCAPNASPRTLRDRQIPQMTGIAADDFAANTVFGPNPRRPEGIPV